MFRKIKEWLRRDDGVTAIEFSLLFMPYMVITLGIIELSLMFASASILEGATDSASRLIRTGTIQQSGQDPELMFRDALCGFAVVLVACEDITVDASVLEDYGDFSGPIFDSDGNVISSGFDVGGANDKVLIRTSYRYQMITPIVGPLLSGQSGSKLFVSTIVLQTEPYEFQGGT